VTKVKVAVQLGYPSYGGSTMHTSAKILVVDDEPINVDILEQELEDLGYQTVSARSGQEALAKVAAESPDLILLDVMMPGMDGFTVCRLLKEKEETQLIPVVFMTALGEKEHRIRGIKAGGYDFFTKPPDRQVLLARIQNAVEMKQAVDRKLKEQVPPDKSFHQEGEYWTIAYQGKVVRAKDTDGLHYIAYLLRYPHREVHVLELVASVGGPLEGFTPVSPREREAAALAALKVQAGFGDAGPILDPQAKAAYKQRLDELKMELGDAQRCNDLGRIAKVEQEIEFLTQELSQAVGLKGKDRRAASPADRARINVQRSIKAALEKLSTAHPALGHSLVSTINTGMYCSYTPDVRIPSPWQF
jgi:CheY-like chemotaxis protein